MPSNQERDRLGVVDGLNRHGSGGRMNERPGSVICPRMGSGRRGRCEAGSPLRQVDLLLDRLGDDEIGIAGPVAPRERDDIVRYRPSLLGREAVGERRHRRAVHPRGHRPEDVFARRPSPEGPALREVCRAYRLTQIVGQRWRRGPVSAAQVTVALQAAGLRVELFPSSMDSFVEPARSGTPGLGTVSGFEKSAEKVVR